MSNSRLAELDYFPDSALRFRALLDKPWAAFLDSGCGGSVAGRYDILTADPYLTLTTRGETTEMRSRDAATFSTRDPLELLAEALGERAPPVESLPFAGGAIGYLAYDLGRRFEKLPARAERDIDMPELAIGLYDWAVVVDHVERRAWLVARGRDDETLARWPELLDSVQRYTGRPRAPFRVLSAIESSFDRNTYASAFARVQDHIRAGDCYQINLTQRFRARAQGDPWAAYLDLRRTNPAPHSAYLDFPFGQVLSSSPESFLTLRGEHVETRPIKGTRPRSADPVRDLALAQALRASEKDRAENVMIVDLLRNDLGKCCLPGSVRAHPLFAIESFASVHHLVSTVSGRLAPDRHGVDLIRAAFPGGSITGAPKLRAMQIIEELEPHRRSVYCGCIGYLGFDRNMDLNIAIRTLVRCGEWIYAWAGGGVVADSEVDAEYQESLDKAAALLAILRPEDAETWRAPPPDARDSPRATA
jgi:para-aminobenzoate synthetase component 1